ncbi:MAG TPA: hypothetical protein VNN20_14815 [Thermodesulfobacteriota bacterium]|nr:hypothetical protein [Thermodesulfobacteriota bacterium]
MPLAPQMHLTLKNLKRDILRKCRNYLIQGNSYAPMYFVNCQIYRLLEYLMKKRYSSLPGVTSIYLAHGQAVGEIYPGLSDFDLAIVFETLKKHKFYDDLRKPWSSFKRFFPSRDMLLFTRPEFDLWQNFGGGEPLDELRHWKCIYGPDLRLDNYELDSPQAERDRFLHALAKYHTLLSSVIKEEPGTPYIAVAARRSLYKAFCSSVLPLDRKYLNVGNQFQRLQRWSEDNRKENNPVVRELIKMRETRFHSGSISAFRFSACALAYEVIDKALENFTCGHNFPPNGVPGYEKTIPLSNLSQVKEKINVLALGIAELLQEKLETVMLASDGSHFGYKLLCILRSGLSAEEVEEALRAVHVVFRIQDNPWFNEHFPAKVPIIYSRNMFKVHLQLWPFDRNYLHSHRVILYGRDLYQELTETRPVTGERDNFEDELLRERINFSRYLHQAYLERLKPALYHAVTLIFPRLYVLHELGWAPSTAEEAIFYYEKIKTPEVANYPGIFFKKYGNKNIDTIVRTMPEDEFEKVWDFLTEEFMIEDYQAIFEAG